jgi:hypothetical protein
MPTSSWAALSGLPITGEHNGNTDCCGGIFKSKKRRSFDCLGGMVALAVIGATYNLIIEFGSVKTINKLQFDKPLSKYVDFQH